jgi:hypothetical protein
MKKGLFITDINLYVNDALTNGIVKKILHQISALNIDDNYSRFLLRLYLIMPLYSCLFHI